MIVSCAVTWLLVQCSLFLRTLSTPIYDDVKDRTHLIDLEVRSAYNGNDRRVLSVNGHLDSYGPTIRVNSGDNIRLHLRNSICSQNEVNKGKTYSIWREYCETALHFHGLTPIGNQNDGVPGFTQPPILSGESFWYNFTIPEETCGTFWYHSHSAVQYGDGFRGIFIVDCTRYNHQVNKVIHTLQQSGEIQNGVMLLPEENFDVTNLYEEQVITLSDWYYSWNLDVVKDRVLSYDSTTDPHIDQSLINGISDDNLQFKLQDATEGILIRIINTGMSGTQIFHVEGHKLVIVEADGILVNPYVLDTLSLAVGQRYTLLVKLADDINYRGVKVVNGCSKMMGYIEKTAWFVKEAVDKVTLDSPSNIKALPGLDKNELYKSLEPTYEIFEDRKGLWVEPDIKTIELNYEYFSDSHTKEKYGTGMYKMNGKTLNEYLESPVEFNTGQVVQIIINANDHMRHPWHLHGHPFQLVSIGSGHEGALNINDLNNNAGRKYKDDIKYWQETGKTPMTRDSINIQGRSYAVIRIIANSPGFWLMHCHIDWHVQKGLGVAFHELEPRSLPDSVDSAQPPSHTEEMQQEESHGNETIDDTGTQSFPHRHKVLAIYFLIMVFINCIVYQVIM
ncbi:hypothetical protein HG535_0A00710 [Zygotorulaspora mrakii]|uniref:Multicopper oxidase n=1 Tax=Zygotorulaspora mrakii TaxID=42260 RepID=A0A7H9AX22_ZYGMR|nr:uncharacterized protein HG535_0A00710 [Zygotorulaspora mrakii]QLG70132.1 hypothetical protein HG535_0A00710 [Zygotorulaspora mrakii]